MAMGEVIACVVMVADMSLVGNVVEVELVLVLSATALGASHALNVKAGGRSSVPIATGRDISHTSII